MRYVDILRPVFTRTQVFLLHTWGVTMTMGHSVKLLGDTCTKYIFGCDHHLDKMWQNTSTALHPCSLQSEIPSLQQNHEY